MFSVAGRSSADSPSGSNTKTSAAKKMKTISIFLLVFSAALFSCNNQPAQELDSPTKGKISFSVDQNVQDLTEQLIETFESSYPDAFLMASFKSERDVINDLYQDSSRLAILTRRLSAEERNYFEKDQKFGIEEIKIASDAIVFIVNKSNADTSFSKATLRKILLGQDSLWSQITPGSERGRIDVVFDNGASSNLRYLTDTLLNGEKPGKNVFAAANADSVFAYVSRNPGALGVIALNTIGDRDSEVANNRRNLVTVCAAGADTLAAYKPSQAAVVTGKYPFVRDIYIVKIGKRAGLGTGFASFALGERGQLIVQRAGLAPAAPAERKIQLTEY